MDAAIGDFIYLIRAQWQHQDELHWHCTAKAAGDCAEQCQWALDLNYRFLYSIMRCFNVVVRLSEQTLYLYHARPGAGS